MQHVESVPAWRGEKQTEQIDRQKTILYRILHYVISMFAPHRMLHSLELEKRKILFISSHYKVLLNLDKMLTAMREVIHSGVAVCCMPSLLDQLPYFCFVSYRKQPADSDGSKRNSCFSRVHIFARKSHNNKKTTT